MTERSTAVRRSLIAADSHRVLLDIWAVADPVMQVHVLHGLAEHPARYERFGRYCNEANIQVAAHCHRGHGEHLDTEDLGHFADENGWDKVLSDVKLVYDHLVEDTHRSGNGDIQRLQDWDTHSPDSPRRANRDTQGIPIVLLGHSMGSYIAQSFVMRGLGRPDGLILSGSTLAPLLQLRMGHWLAAWEQFRRDPAANSKRLNDLGIGALNRRFEPARTPSDWLSRDEAEVDKYVNDPHCGADSSIGLWHQLTAGLLEISSARAMKKVDSDLPILITGGASDPVGGRKGMTRLAQGYRNTGHRNVTLKIYDGGRHEMLNEINRDEFMHDLRTWLLDNVPIRSE